jgi:carbonic anhydrase
MKKEEQKQKIEEDEKKSFEEKCDQVKKQLKRIKENSKIDPRILKIKFVI